MLHFFLIFGSIFVTFYPDSRVGGHSKLDTCFEGEDTITPAMLIKSLGVETWWDWYFPRPKDNITHKPPSKMLIGVNHFLLVNHGDRLDQGRLSKGRHLDKGFLRFSIFLVGLHFSCCQRLSIFSPARDHFST